MQKQVHKLVKAFLTRRSKPRNRSQSLVSTKLRTLSNKTRTKLLVSERNTNISTMQTLVQVHILTMEVKFSRKKYRSVLEMKKERISSVINSNNQVRFQKQATMKLNPCLTKIKNSRPQEESTKLKRIPTQVLDNMNKIHHSSKENKFLL